MKVLLFYLSFLVSSFMFSTSLLGINVNEALGIFSNGSCTLKINYLPNTTKSFSIYIKKSGSRDDETKDLISIPARIKGISEIKDIYRSVISRESYVQKGQISIIFTNLNEIKKLTWTRWKEAGGFKVPLSEKTVTCSSLARK